MVAVVARFQVVINVLGTFRVPQATPDGTGSQYPSGSPIAMKMSAQLSSDDKLVPEFENSHTQDQVPEDLNLESQFRLVYRASAAHVPKESLS